jgi:hypothetical protein
VTVLPRHSSGQCFSFQSKYDPSRGASQSLVICVCTPHLQSAEIRYRPVKIYRPTKSTMQSAKGKTKRWILDWDTLQGAGRWENPLIGWASSADYVQGTSMTFASKEDAIGFVSTSTSTIGVSYPDLVLSEGLRWISTSTTGVDFSPKVDSVLMPGRATRMGLLRRDSQSSKDPSQELW